MLASLLAACAAGPSQSRASRAEARQAFVEWTDADYRYRVGAGDELSLNFLINPDMNARLVVGPDGRVVLPLAGPIKVSGLTAEELNATLTRSYSSVLRNPQVEALVTTYGSSQIYVGGEVRLPGVHQIKGDLNAAQAVMLAGGFQETARTGKVVVLRQRVGDRKLAMRVVDVADMINEADNSQNFPLLPGDLIFVPRSGIAEVDLFVAQYITGVLPFSRNFNVNRGDGVIN
ncbi:polysaccharide biosynthesis/export family protein [Caulobacter sp. NIBR2454]|uniref:polysaccharide biosynthesis/export family protein n=1 Tax=Caulobacter sp. NIBR2454 TaxID=3015996 RepID=UPI0022B749EA|nr:polysaccharide biosynthesis/export family protein [Caulobacter sp. NIBR2454]